MKITADPKRIEEAHDLLQQLEDEVAMYQAYKVDGSSEHINKTYCNRLESIYKKVWDVIYLLNEVYDGDK